METTTSKIAIPQLSGILKAIRMVPEKHSVRGNELGHIALAKGHIAATDGRILVSIRHPAIPESWELLIPNMKAGEISSLGSGDITVTDDGDTVTLSGGSASYSARRVHYAYPDFLEILGMYPEGSTAKPGFSGMGIQPGNFARLLKAFDSLGVSVSRLSITDSRSPIRIDGTFSGMDVVGLIMPCVEP
jgi:hypothetical protein